MHPAPIYQYKHYHYSYEYDYIICGAGAAGLSLLMRMLLSGKFNDKTFLLVDKDRKQNNDRTWCFWERDPGFFDELVYKSWNKVRFHGPDFSKEFTITPYTYKMIRGIDFYNHCINYIKQQKNVRLLFEPVRKIVGRERYADLVLENGEVYQATEYLFNSVLFQSQVTEGSSTSLLQHFKGWVIETNSPVFNPDSNTIMDFRIEQNNGTSFVYTMPFTQHSALVEYTVFSDKVLDQAEYDKGLENYIRDFLLLENYSIKEKEFGVIPMSNFRFPVRDGRIMHIGTAGGQTKSSSGYTFQFIQRHSDSILRSLLNHGHPFVEQQYPRRFRFYDNVLLDVLNNKELQGGEIFTRLFRHNSARRIFRFLDNDTWMLEELLLIRCLPTLPFLRSARRVL